MKTRVYQSGIDSYFNEMYIENALLNIEDTINLFEKLINNDNISFADYIDTLSKLYNINITDNDLFKISSIILGGNTSEIILDTDITYDVTRRIENNNIFTYNDEIHKLYVKVAYIDSINTTHKYTYNELIEMVNNKKIVVLNFILDEESDDYCDDEISVHGLLPLGSITSNNFANLKYIRNDYVPYIYSYLKSYFTVERIKRDFYTYLSITKDKLITTENHISDVLARYSSKVKRYEKINKSIGKIQRKISEK